jgi:hypothetical protein
MAIPAALALDSSNDVLVTGSALTVKYDRSGNALWTAPYGGTTLAVDSDANVYVGGFSQDFGVVKLSPQGSNLWLQTYVETYGPTVSQSVLVDTGNNVYVSGLDTFMNVQGGTGPGYGQFVQVTTIKYDPNGVELWRLSKQIGKVSYVQVTGAALDGVNNLYVAVSSVPSGPVYRVIKYSTTGSISWTASNPDESCESDMPHSLEVDRSGEVFVTGQSCYFAPNNAYATFVYGTYKAATNGSWLWGATYPSAPAQPSVATSIAVDSANKCYVTGFSPGENASSNIVTIKYDSNGNQIWLQRYGGVNNGGAVGNAIAVDNNGNVYVAGYETTAAGGTEMVLIKYAPVAIQRRADGTVLLQAQGSPGESFDVQASTNLQTWQDLGSVTADTNGLAQFDDTNAPIFDSRFYLTVPQ